MRWALVELLLGQALAQANVMWHEVEQSRESCAGEVGEFVDLVIAASVQLESVKKCLSRSTPRNKSRR